VTSLQAAKAECDNCDSIGNCSGIGIRIEPNGDLKLYRFREEGRCWLLPDAGGNIKRCEHFEGIVIATAENRARAAVTQEHKYAAAKLTEAVHAYEMAVMPVPTAKHAKCKGCQQNVIAPKRFCPRCTKRRKLQSNNRSRMRKTAAVAALITNDL
jgi:hypothetical protein